MKKLTLLVILIVGFMSVIFTDVNKVQAIDVDESNYRVPVVGGTQGNPAFEITRFDCDDPNTELPHIAFGNRATQTLILMDINLRYGASDLGTPIYSSGNGTVVDVDSSRGLVQIENSEMGNYYGHMVKIYVIDDQPVVKGQLIGLMGNVGASRGSHLHWETYPKPGYSFDPTQIQGVEETVAGGGCTSNDYDGLMWGQSLNNYNDCEHIWNSNTGNSNPPIILYDARKCQGNTLVIPNNGQIYNLSDLGFDDRVRSIYMQGDSDGNGRSVLMGPDSNNRSANNYCWHNDMWNTDVNYYKSPSGQPSLRIGWDSGNTSGSNMISWVQVHNNNDCSGQGNNNNSGTLTLSADENIGGGSYGQYGNSAVDIRENANCTSGQYGWNGATNGIFNLSPDINYMDNKTTCIDVDYGFSIMVYADANGLGANRCFNHTVSDLQNAYFSDGTNGNDVISSVQVFTNLDCSGQLSYGLADGDMITVWENGNYSGQSYGWHGTGNYNFSNFGASSIGVMQGWSALVYENTNQGGIQTCVISSDPYLTGDTYYSGVQIEDNIESLTIFHDINCGGWTPPLPPAPDPVILTLYEHSDFNGVNYSISATGVYNLQGTNMNNQASSFGLLNGYSVLMHSGSDGSGGGKCFTANDLNLNNDIFDNNENMNDNVESLRVFADTNCNGWTPYVPPTGGNGTGLRGEYFNNMDLTDSVLVRVDSTVNFNWGGNSPDTLVGADTFSVRWTGFVQPLYTGNYVYSTTTDDGVRLSVNNQQVINNWTDHGSTQDFSGNVWLEAGVKYPITLEFYDNGWDAKVELRWQSASQPLAIIPQSQLYPPEAPQPPASCSEVTDGPAVLFADINCQGSSMILSNVGVLVDITSLGVSSIHVQSGWSVRVTNSLGESVCHNWDAWNYTLDTWQPSGTNMNDTAVSAKLYNVGDCPEVSATETPVATNTDAPTGLPTATETSTLVPTETATETLVPTATNTDAPTGCPAVTQAGVTLFSDPYCAGTSMNFTESGTYDLVVLGFTGTTSIRIQQGIVITVQNGTGQSKCLPYDPYNLAEDVWPDGTTNMNDSITQLIVTIGGSC